MSGTELPAAFRSSLPWLRKMNPLSMGLSLAALSGGLLHGSEHALGLAAVLPTPFFGIVMAHLLRRMGRTRARWRWLASAPLAMTNVAVGAAILEPSDILRSLTIGATAGAIVWIPLLVFTMLCFGGPIETSQRLAAEGLAGEEHGERRLAMVCTTVAVVGLVAAALFGPKATVYIPQALPVARSPAATLGAILTWSLGILGASTGAWTVMVARRRERERRAFVADVASGEVAGYRVETFAEGKRLIRVATEAIAYRVADREDEVYALDETGAARHALPAPPVSNKP